MLIRRKTMLSVVMHDINVIQTHTNLVSSRIVRYKPYTTSVVCDEGYSVYEITIKMGGVDITSTAYDATYNMISIPSVTDDVDIECYAMHTMPSDYVHVDGIKNPRNAYLDTGYYVTPNNRLELHMSIEKLSATTYHATSKRSVSGAIGSGWYTGISAYSIQANVNDISVSLGLDTTKHIGEYYEFILDYYKKVSHIKGYNSKTLPEKTSTDPNTFAIFASPENYGNAPNRVVKYFHIYDYATTSYVRYYIPCLNDSGVAGFWDAARGVFQGSSNSTAFEACYTQSGLVFQLDGINKGATADAWTDLVGGHVFANNGAISQDNGWQIDNGKYLKKTPGISMDIHNNYTVEVCVTPTSAPPHMVFVLNNTSNKNQPLFMVNTGNIVTFIQMVKTCTFPSYAANNSHCISINYDRGCHNGLIVANYGSSDYWNSSSDESFIGRRNSSTPHPFKGVIHAIRIYNRRLTLEEMKFNQRIDNKRFNLGLTI